MRHLFYALAVVAGIAILGCAEKRGDSPAPNTTATGQAAVSPAGQHGGWWCAEHGVPEEECGLCDSSLAAELQKKGDWCAEHDRPDRVIFVEGARITLEAHIAEYPPAWHAELRRALAIGDRWRPDKVIVLTSSTDTIEKHIRRRRRPHEEADRTVQRFRLIDAEFRRLAPHYPNAVLVDRDGREFHDREGLASVIREVGLPPFAEVPYRDMDRFQPL